MVKNELITADILSLGTNGEGVSRAEGMAVFVNGALVGERVLAKVLSVKGAVCYAKLLEVIIRSPDREKPPCPVYSVCGGCALQHMSYEAELRFKTELVRNTLKKIGNIGSEVLPCEPSDKIYGYRNKLSLPAGMRNGKPVFGFYRQNSHDIVETDCCLLNGDTAQKIIAAFTNYCAAARVSCYDGTSGLLRHIVCREHDGYVQLCAVINGNTLPAQSMLTDILSEVFSDFSLLVNINKSNTNIILGSSTRVIKGSPVLRVRSLGIEREIEVSSFLQINDYIADRLYSDAIQRAECGADTIAIDAYCGAGALTTLLAKNCRQVYGVEIVPEATASAKKLVTAQRINNAEFITGDCAEVLPKLVKQLDRSPSSDRVVILDPPRKGCSESVLNAVINFKPDRIVYISCDPATLARDLKTLCASYSVTYIKPYDMFPRTANVETLTVLKIKG